MHACIGAKMCMHMYVCMYLYMCAYVCIDVCRCSYTHTCIHSYMQVRIYAYTAKYNIYIYMYEHTCRNLKMNICMGVYMYANIICIRAYLYLTACGYTYEHMHALAYMHAYILERIGVLMYLCKCEYMHSCV